jgi:hypothetical protein
VSLKITNKHGLPAAFVRAIENDPYNSGGSDFTATSLSDPPRASALIKQHWETLEIDASTRVAATIGQGTHSIAERAARPGIDICETRFFADFIVDGVTYKVSSQIDLYETDTCTLIDWKTTKSYAFSKKAGGGQKPEWITQLNIGAEILRRNRHDPKALQIIALLKDWNKREAGTSACPPTEVMPVDIPMWTREQSVEYIENRIRLHVAARESLPQCTSTETWAGRKCPDWCDAKSVCEQFAAMKKTGLVESLPSKEKSAPRAIASGKWSFPVKVRK